MQFKSDFLRESSERGYIHQGTDLEGLDALMSKKSVRAYLGFDATARSLHVGSLIQIMRLRLLQKTGHKPIVLMGGGTTRIGDPSGKDEMRKILSQEEIEANVTSITRIYAKYLKFGDGPSDAQLLNNAEWLDQLPYLEFLGQYGRYFSINRLLTFDSVRSRLERDQPLSFLEFNYMILQAYDFLELNRRYDVELQLGGADQWGNIICGIDLTQRVLHKTIYGLTSPLITTSTGAKMGKTAQGAVWLDSDLLSPYDFWQYWRNTPDTDVGKFLRLFTEIPLDEILRLEKLQDSEINEAKKILADEVTRLCHGDQAVDDARKAARNLFENGGGTQGSLESSLPTVIVELPQLKSGIPFVDLLILSGLTASKSEARRLIRGNGARLNDELVSEEGRLVTTQDLTSEGVLKLSSGKKRHALLRTQR